MEDNLIDFEKGDGLVPAVIQDAATGEALMLGYMNRDALHRTLGTGEVTFFSRSRSKLWTKGETSGHKLLVRDVRVDCDGDALLILAERLGPGVCHTGHRSCWYRRWDGVQWVETEAASFDAEAVYGGAR